jgi:phosphate-selective porin OprO/OprP
MHRKFTRLLLVFLSLGVALTTATCLQAAATDSDTDSEFYLWDEEFSLKEALSFESADGANTLRIGGRLQLDAAWFDNDKTDLNNDSTDAEFRRARLYAAGKLYENWRYRFAYDFAANSNYRVKAAWIGYNGFKPVSIRAGNVLQPFSLEAMTSSNVTTFMERGLPYGFAPNYRLGAKVNTYGDSWSAALGLFGDAVRGGSVGEDGKGAAARLTAAPVNSKQRLFHIGASLLYQDPDEARYRSRPEAHLSDERLVSTGTLNGVDDTLTWGLETAGVYGPLSLQAEYMQVSVNRDNRSEPDFDGWYVYGSWFVTGEHRRYNVKKGTFKQIRPKSKYGALELAVRYSSLDLEDKNITGGEEKNLTLGLNWYLNRNVRFMANYIRADADPNSNGQDETPNIFQLRAQLVF